MIYSHVIYVLLMISVTGVLAYAYYGIKSIDDVTYIDRAVNAFYMATIPPILLAIIYSVVSIVRRLI